MIKVNSKNLKKELADVVTSHEWKNVVLNAFNAIMFDSNTHTNLMAYNFLLELKILEETITEKEKEKDWKVLNESKSSKGKTISAVKK